MSLYSVIYDAEKNEEFERNIKPLLNEEECHFIAYKKDMDFSIEKDEKVLVWLGDEALYSLLPYAAEQQWSVGFLPHPEMKSTYRSFFVPKEVEAALENIVGANDPVSADLMFCNNQLVLGSVVLGNMVAMGPMATIDNGIWSQFKDLVSLTFRLSKLNLSAYKLETDKGAVLNTAALGITAVYRPSGSDFSTRMVEEMQKDEASLNAVILAPRSIAGVIKFLFTRIFRSDQRALELADYIGHVKTQSLTITGQRELSFSIDGEEQSAEKIDIVVKPNAIKILNQKLPNKVSDEEVKESVRVASIPTGQAIVELVERPLPWIYHVDQEEIKETFINLKNSACATEAYLVLMVLSTLLATVGLFANSAPVIIGAMILAPLMSPIVSLSMGVLRQNRDLMVTSSKTLFIGILLALSFGTLLTLLTPLQTINSEIGARLSPTILDLGVAIISGMAAAYANARSEVAKSLAGVAIAVALVPPLAVAGIGIGWLDWHVFWGAFLLFTSNLVGMVLAAAATFLVMGFSPFHLAKKGMSIALVFVVMVSIPLVFAFAKMVDGQKVVHSLEGWKVAGIEVKNVRIRNHGSPLYLSVTLLSDGSLNTQKIDQVKQSIETRLDREIRLEVNTAVLR